MVWRTTRTVRLIERHYHIISTVEGMKVGNPKPTIRLVWDHNVLHWTGLDQVGYG